MAVKHLEKKQGRHPEIHGKGDGIWQDGRDIPAGGRVGGLGPHFPDQRDHGAAQHGVHEHKMGEKGQDKKELEKFPGRRDGVWGRDELGWIHGRSPEG